MSANSKEMMQKLSTRLNYSNCVLKAHFAMKSRAHLDILNPITYKKKDDSISSVLSPFPFTEHPSLPSSISRRAALAKFKNVSLEID